MPYGKLYDLSDDLGELQDLNAEERGRVAPMMQLASRIRTSTGSG